MLLVPNLEMVQCAWITIKSGTHYLYGFLLFVAGDHFFPQYLSNEGLADLECWTANNCQIFILQSPSAQWIDYSRRNDTLWWKLFKGTTRPPQINNRPSPVEGSLWSRQFLPVRPRSLEEAATALNPDLLETSPVNQTQHTDIISSVDYWEDALQVKRNNHSIAGQGNFVGSAGDEHTVQIDGRSYSINELF